MPDENDYGLELTLEQEFEIQNLLNEMTAGKKANPKDVANLLRLYFIKSNALKAAYRKIIALEFGAVENVKKEG